MQFYILGFTFHQSQDDSDDFDDVVASEEEIDCSQNSSSDYTSSSEDNYESATSSESEEDDDVLEGPFNMPEGSQKVYCDAKVTVFECSIMLMSLLLHGHISYFGLQIVLKIFQTILPEPNLVFSTVYKLKKFFSVDTVKRTDHSFCTKCYSLISEKCSVCDIGTPKSTFATYDVIEQIQNMFRRPNFLADVTLRHHEVNDGSIRKITDGALRNGVEKYLSSPWDLTLMMYTDGAQLFNSSKSSVWPIVFAINELPFTKRFLPHNLILGGLWYSPIKPNFNTFMLPLFDSFQKLKSGINMFLFDKKEIVKALILNLTADKPAKAAVLNMKGHNGKNSCPKCKIVGKSVAVEGCTRKKFCFQEKESELRDSKSAIDDGLRATPTVPVNGFKGPNNFSKFVPDFINGIAEDVMHGLYGGVGGKKMLEFWFSSKYQSKTYSLLNNLIEVETRLKKIKPPNFIKRRLRSISQVSNFKTSEYKNWLLYYSVPILHDIMDPEHFKHYFSLVKTTYVLNSECILPSEIELAATWLIDYANEFERLYGPQHMTANLHSLLHYAETVRQLGPLYETSCFPLESFLGVLKKFVLGPNSPSVKITESFNLLHNMPLYISKIAENSTVRNIVEEIRYGKTTMIEIYGGIYIVGKLKPCSGYSSYLSSCLDDYHEIHTHLKATKVWSFRKLQNENCTVVANNNERFSVYDSSAVKLRNGKLFRVESFTMYKLCKCEERCQCEAYYRAVGHECVCILNEKIPKNNFINEICLSMEVTSVCVREIEDVCAFICVGDKKFCCLRLNKEKE
jgi:hypothetical protein